MSDLREAAATFFARRPELRLRALGARENAPLLDLAPLGVEAGFLDAAREPRWVERYHAANVAAFPGPLGLPGWVLADLYLMPAAIGVLTDGDDIVAAYYAAPAIEPGVVIGVSLFASRAGEGAGAMVKTLTLKMLRARKLRGVTRWGTALRTHTRMGALSVLGRVPKAHAHADTIFAYAVDLTDEARWAAALSRPSGQLAPEGCRRISSSDHEALSALLDRAEEGEPIVIAPPGSSPDGAEIYVVEG